MAAKQQPISYTPKTIPDLEIQQTAADHPVAYRALEILPGLLAWLFLLSPFYLSFISPLALAYIIIAYELAWFIRIFGLSFRLMIGHFRVNGAERVDWVQFNRDLRDIEAAKKTLRERLKRTSDRGVRYFMELHQERLEALEQDQVLNPKDVYHEVIIAVYNESQDVVEPTIRSLKGIYDPKKLLVVIAYEERGGVETEKMAKRMAEDYKNTFGDMKAIRHPDGIPGEHRGKGANITYAANKYMSQLKKQKIDPAYVVVTTLDADNRPSENYFQNLTYEFASHPNRHYCSFQPIPRYFTNIWDVPTPMRVIASSNSFWGMSEAPRPHRVRNFSAHAQSLTGLMETDFWSKQTIVEDGHQYWRSYFGLKGKHHVVALYTIINQDAVLAQGYWRTFKMQFIQLRRWAWGASDIPYLVIQSVRHKKLPLGMRLLNVWRLTEGHFGWATAALILLFAAWVPALFNQDLVLALQLPVVVSRVQLIANLGIAVMLLMTILTLPPRPARYKRRRNVLMIAQWAFLPLTTILFNTFAGINAQTRLMLGKRLEKFDVTEKVVRK